MKPVEVVQKIRSVSREGVNVSSVLIGIRKPKSAKVGLLPFKITHIFAF